RITMDPAKVEAITKWPRPTSVIEHGYWASLRVKPDLISRIKKAQKEDNEIWTIVKTLDEQTEFHFDEDDVLW
nr:zinc finger, CCHC-type, retrotransposon Gag domain protein [Tanacetum cinerariifolium]